MSDVIDTKLNAEAEMDALINMLCLRCDDLQSERQAVLDENDALRAENMDLRKELVEAQKQLASGTMSGDRPAANQRYGSEVPEMDGIKHKAVERIWLGPDAGEGELGYVWCDDPAPGTGMDLEDAVEYVRKDVHDARLAKIEQERDALAAHIERLNGYARVCSEELVSMIDKRNVQSDSDGSWMYDHQTPWDLMNAVHTAPATSLARRDLIVASNELERAYRIASRKYKNSTAPLKDLLDRALELRRQADQLELGQ